MQNFEKIFLMRLWFWADECLQPVWMGRQSSKEICQWGGKNLCPRVGFYPFYSLPSILNPYPFSLVMFGFLDVFIQQVVYGLVHVFKPFVVLSFQCLKFDRKIFVVQCVLPDKNKGPHYWNIYVYCFITVQNSWKHRNPLFCKCKGQVSCTASFVWGAKIAPQSFPFSLR